MRPQHHLAAKKLRARRDVTCRSWGSDSSQHSQDLTCNTTFGFWHRLEEDGNGSVSSEKEQRLRPHDLGGKAGRFLVTEVWGREDRGRFDISLQMLKRLL